MNLEYFIARKVARSGQKSFSRLIIRIAIVAIALSVTVMIVATSLIRGFKSEISSKIFGFWGHIHITDTNVNRSLEAIPVKRDQTFYKEIPKIKSVQYPERRRILGWQIDDEPVRMETKGGVNHIQSFALQPGIIKTKNELEGIILKGISTDYDVKRLDQYLEEGSYINTADTIMSRDIIISRQTANRLNLKLDDQFRIHFVIEGKQLKRRFKIKGIYKTGLEEYDKKFALIDIRVIQQLLGWEENEVSGFEVFIDNIDELDPINEYIYVEELPNNLFSQTIRTKHPSIFEWLELQDINELVILILMIVVAIINMVTALMILILERTNMIGILKALGQTNWNVRKIFLYHAAYIIGIGLLWGNIIGIGLCFLQRTFEIVKLSEADYYLSVAPIQLHFGTILLINIGTLAITILFLIIPSYLVTSISPVKAIRFK